MLKILPDTLLQRLTQACFNAYRYQDHFSFPALTDDNQFKKKQAEKLLKTSAGFNYAILSSTKSIEETVILESLSQPTCRRIMIRYFVPYYRPRNNEGNKIMKPMKDMAKSKEHSDNSVSIEFCAALKADILLTVYYIWKIWNCNW